jgi:hypothetical protein
MTCSGARACRLLVCVLLFTAVAQASAQTGFAFRGSADRCKSYLILEAGWLSRVSQSGVSARSSFLIPMDIGLMKNISPKCALGGSLHVAINDSYGRIGFRPRLKLWTGKRSGFDFSLGATFTSRTSWYGAIKSPIVISEISYSLAELLSIDVYCESYRLKDGGHHTALYLGATGRSYVTLVAPVVFLVAMAIFDPIDIGTGSMEF